jgi:hypothetical protein
MATPNNHAECLWEWSWCASSKPIPQNNDHNELPVVGPPRLSKSFGTIDNLNNSRNQYPVLHGRPHLNNDRKRPIRDYSRRSDVVSASVPYRSFRLRKRQKIPSLPARRVQPRAVVRCLIWLFHELVNELTAYRRRESSKCRRVTTDMILHQATYLVILHFLTFT